ncbi:MAG: hypothetical protein ACRDGA_05635, partial [Bacteroidota bacterium]
AMVAWQRILLKAAGFGAGFAGVLIGALAIWLWIQSMPETPRLWNRDALKASFEEIFVNTGDRPVATFKFILENTTPHDYHLPSDPKSAFILLPEGKGMSQEEELIWDRGAYVPSGQKVTVSFQVSYNYNEAYPKTDRDDLDKLSKFMNRRLKELDGFAVLDRVKRYQIIFPRGWQDSPETKVSKTPNILVVAPEAPRSSTRPSER